MSARSKAPGSSTSLPGCGKEDFALSKVHDLDVIAPLNESGIYVDGFDWLTGSLRPRRGHPDHARSGIARACSTEVQQYTHRYPVCWRCGTDLVFRLVDEWFIAMDQLREPMMRVTKEINWVPSLRPRARARLAGAHGRLDDLQEALLGSRAADLRM